MLWANILRIGSSALVITLLAPAIGLAAPEAGAIAPLHLPGKATTDKPSPALQKSIQASIQVAPPSAIAQATTTPNLDTENLDSSPLLERWLEEIPDVRREIRNDPSFRTRLRLGYAYFPSTDEASGFSVGIEDVFLGRTGFTISADYQQAFERDRQSYGADLHYYLLPLGGYVNLAPTIGYRSLETDEYTTDGVNLGLRLMLALSRGGAADVSLSQSWVNPGSEEEVGMTTLSFGYALTPQLRLSTDLQKQNAPQAKDSRVGILLEWLL